MGKEIKFAHGETVSPNFSYFFMEDSTQIVTWRLQYSQLCNFGISKLYSDLFFFYENVTKLLFHGLRS